MGLDVPVSLLAIDEIPQMAEHYRLKQFEQAASRELDFLGRSYDICGIKVRAMTVMDFCILTHKQNPLLNRGNPSILELCLFLWVIRKGKKSLLRAWMHGREMRKLNPEILTKRCFEYIDQMTVDLPTGGGGEASISFIASWCDAIRNAYNCSKADVLNMGLPELFQSLRAIRQRSNPGRPEANRKTDDIVNRIMIGLNEKRYTLEELRSGTAQLDLN